MNPDDVFENVFDVEKELAETNEIMQAVEPESVLQNGSPFVSSVGAVRQSIDGNAMTADFVIVTRQVRQNRHGNYVQITPVEGGGQGILLQNYERNPVVLFNHGSDFSIPIARSSLPVLKKNVATATATFSQTLPEATQFFHLVAEEILNAASIAFIPVRARLLKLKNSTKKPLDDEIDMSGVYALDFIESEMFEWSIVGVPADPGAIRRCLELQSIGGEKIRQTLLKPLQKMAEPKPSMSGPGPEQLKRERQSKQIDAAIAVARQSLSEAIRPLSQSVGVLDVKAKALEFRAKKLS